jgi:hypothetical protein
MLHFNVRGVESEVQMKYVKLTMVTVILLSVVLYVCDFISFRYKMTYKGTGAALGVVQFLIGVEKKNGAVEIYYGNPQTESCARSLFPQLGHRPCWYASRQTQRIIAPDAQPMFLPDMRQKY